MNSETVQNHNTPPSGFGETTCHMVDRRRRRCIGRIYGACTDWEHCPYCGLIEQALRAIPKGLNVF